MMGWTLTTYSISTREMIIFFNPCNEVREILTPSTDTCRSQMNRCKKKLNQSQESIKVLAAKMYFIYWSTIFGLLRDKIKPFKKMMILIREMIMRCTMQVPEYFRVS